RSPQGWVAKSLQSRPGLRYFAADGTDIAATYDACVEAAAWVRRKRRPAVLHLTMVRLMGHAGADAEVGYRPAAEIAAELERDPLIRAAQLLAAAGVATPEELLGRYDEIGWQVRKVAEEVLGEPKLASAADVVAPLAPRRPVRVARDVAAAGTAVAPTPGGAVTPAAAAHPGDPVPGVPAQRRGPAARRGGVDGLLLARRIQKSPGGAHRGAGVPGGLRRPLPQRQLPRRVAGHPGARPGLPGAPG